MKRPLVNALLDLTAALLILAMAATGLVLEFVLPPGSGRSWVLWSLERHDWAAAHAYTSAALLVVLAVHVALHWRWVTEMVCRRWARRRVSPRALGAVVVGGLVLFFATFGGVAYQTRAPRQSLVECLPPADPGAEAGDGSVSYERHVAPLFALRCVGCHDAHRARAGVRLDDYESVRALALPAEGTEGRLLAVLRAARDPAHTVDANSLAQLERWVEGGAAR